MKINEIIRIRRIELGYTQEQVARLLEVSTPAVNKWEKGISFPDITLLPALARLLNTDLNSLLSFKEDLSDNEIAIMMNKVSDLFEKEGFVPGYELAISYIKEFPNSDTLMVNMANLLDGGLVLYGKDINSADYDQVIVSLYNKVVSNSKDISLKEQAQISLINKLTNKKDYDSAQAILDTMAKDRYFDKKQTQAKLYLARGELDKASQLVEENLLTKTNNIHLYLMTLMEIALKQERIEDAKYIANIDSQLARLLDLSEYSQYVLALQLYDSLGDKEEGIDTLIAFLKSLNNSCDNNKSVLYRHIKTNNDNDFGMMIQNKIITSIDDQEVIDKLRNVPELKEMFK